jgi:hypothetical protein
MRGSARDLRWKWNERDNRGQQVSARHSTVYNPVDGPLTSLEALVSEVL